MHTENEFIDNSDDLTKLCQSIVGAEFGDYITKLTLIDGSWIEISASHEDGELFIQHKRAI